ncbi:MAG: hypothetical protein R6V02_06750 [Candidatus Aminicenantes bacterium]
MVKGSEHTKITKDDMNFVIDELSKNHKAPSLQELIKKVAFKKNANQLNQEVKIYDSACKYEVGDLICKQYDESLMVSSKGSEPFKGKIVLEVTNKIPFDSFNCEMLEVDYTGGGTFRRHIDYMKKTKTQVMLPSAANGKEAEPEILPREEDPRLHELSMTDKDLRQLGKNLEAALSKSGKFFSWNHHWQLTEKQVEVSKKTIDKIETGFKKSRKSASTEELAAAHLNVQPGDDRMDLSCLSLNYVLSRSRKRNFLFVSPEGWGRWFLRDILQSFLKNNPLSAPKIAVPELKDKALHKAPDKKFPLKVYLSWREILGGGVIVPEEFKRELSAAREFRFFDVENKKEYTVYYYPDNHIFLGLDEYYQEYNVPQGASITLAKEGINRFRFWLKKSKKKVILPVLKYDPENDRFAETGKEITTYLHPNKIIFLAHGTLKKVLSLYPQRKGKDLRELLVLIFRHFGLEGEALTLHYLRAFHLATMLANTTTGDVSETLQSSPEFIPSEKKKGLFLYHDKLKRKAQLKKETEAEMEEKEEAWEKDEEKEDTEEGLPEIGTVGEVVSPEIILEEKKEIELPEEEGERAVPSGKTVPAEVAVPEPEAELEDEAELDAAVEEKEKPDEKESIKKKIELEKKPRRQKGGKRYIEERIEQEESEWEAFYALKAGEEFEDDKMEELPGAKKQEKEKPYGEPAEEEKSSSGLFAEKLKSALGQKEEKPGPGKKKSKQKKSSPKKASGDDSNKAE